MMRAGFPTTGRSELIDVAAGAAPADKVIRGGSLVNVLTREIYPADIAIKGCRIAAVGDVEYTCGPATGVIDADGCFLTPGLIDGHLHSYQSCLDVPAFAEVMLTHGVTAIADSFYAHAIVGGIEAVRFLRSAFERMPIRLIFLVPALAYLQNRELGLTPTQGISRAELLEILDWDGCYGLEEPPFMPIIDKWPEFLELFEATLLRRKVVSGHALGITERELAAYVAMGASTDHECMDAADGLRKARAGMTLLMRQASGAENVSELVRLYTEYGIDSRSLGFSVDFASPEKLTGVGGIDANVRVAIENGLPPIIALQIATINIAQVFNAQQDIGCIAPGRYADILVATHLAQLEIRDVIAGGDTVVRNGKFVADLPTVEYPAPFRDSVRLRRQPEPRDFLLSTDRLGTVEVRVIAAEEGSIVTREERWTLAVEGGSVRCDPSQDILHLAMIDRLGKGTGIGLGFARGFGLTRGAMASSVSTATQNIVVLGVDPKDMTLAVSRLAEAGGGKIVVAGGEVLAFVELPLLGLMSDRPLDVVVSEFKELVAAAELLGCRVAQPFVQLEFCFASGEVGDIKLSEEGLVRVSPPARLDVVLPLTADE